MIAICHKCLLSLGSYKSSILSKIDVVCLNSAYMVASFSIVEATLLSLFHYSYYVHGFVILECLKSRNSAAEMGQQWDRNGSMMEVNKYKQSPDAVL